MCCHEGVQLPILAGQYLKNMHGFSVEKGEHLVTDITLFDLVSITEYHYVAELFKGTYNIISFLYNLQ